MVLVKGAEKAKKPLFCALDGCAGASNTDRVDNLKPDQEPELSHLAITMQAFCPPKPKELDSAVSTCTCRA
jgi:hypothetical protein